MSVGEQIIGSAPHTNFWIMLGYTQSMESKALEQATLPEPVRSHLKLIRDTIPRSKILLIRHRATGAIPLYVARTSQDNPALYRFDLEQYEDVLSLDLTPLASDAVATQPSQVMDPIWLICTNGKRDPCCSQWGVPLFNSLQKMRSDRVFETSHLGGHRFAGNAVCLPDGIYYGRLTSEAAEDFLSAQENKEILLDNYRGRVCYPPIAQAGEYYLRSQTNNAKIDAFKLVEVTQASETNWKVQFVQPELHVKHYLSIRTEWSEFKNIESCSKPGESSSKLQFHLEEYYTG